MGSRRSLQVRRDIIVMTIVALAAAFCSLLIFAYNPEQDNVNSMPWAARWPNNTVTWSINPTTGSNVHSTGGDPVTAAVGKAFSAWQQASLNGQVVDSLSITQGGNSSLTAPDTMDCVNVVGFVDSSTTDFPTGTIAFTDLVTSFGSPPTTYTCTTSPTSRTCLLKSCIIDGDIEFNPKEQFSTTTPPMSSNFDLQSIATHEIGHLLGLDHSGIGHTVMFPFGDTEAAGQQRTLAIDDVAGVAFLYPASTFSSLTGTISGTVTLGGGSGIFASHVIAVDSATGAAVLDGLTNPDGTYTLVGVPPGSYNVLALPLGPDANSGIYTLDDFGGWYCGYSENSPPCCDPTVDKTCTGTRLANPTNYTGKFY